MYMHIHRGRDSYTNHLQGWPSFDTVCHVLCNDLLFIRVRSMNLKKAERLESIFLRHRLCLWGVY